jgi:TolB-like protein/Flp pilus assembly protein TadD
MAEHGESENHPPVPTGEAAATSARMFISYASHDVEMAQKVCSALEAAGLACWMAPRDVKAGAQYADAIVRAINQVKAVVLVLSGSAVVSSHVAREVERAASKRKQIIAFRIDDAPLSPELEYFLSNSQWIEVPKLGMPTALAKLKEAVGQESASSSLSNPVTRRGSRMAKRFVIAAAALIAVGVAVALRLHFWSGNHSGALTPAAAAITDKSIAVLPFVDMSEKKDQEYFADGLAEELLDLLAQVPDLKVPARSSSFFFKGSSVPVRNVGHDLGVAYVLEGGVRKAGDIIRVSVQLVRADSGYQVWAQTYERNVRDIFKVQDEISAAVVDAFKLRLSSSGPQIVERRTAIPEAYDQYLRGKHLFQLGDYDGLVAAGDAYRRAIELDPNFGPAFADLAMVEYLAVKDISDTDQPDVIRQAMDHADHAIALAPSLAEAYSDRALLRFAQYDWAGARADLQKALALDPSDVKANRRMVLLELSLGNVDAALSAQRHVVDLDPLNTISLEILGFSYYYAGQGAGARRTFEKVRVLSPKFEGLSGNAGFSYLADGQPAAARRECEPYPDDTARACLAAAEHALGHDERSRAILADLIEKHPRRASYFIAKAYGFSGNSALAFEWLNRAFSAQVKYLTDFKSEPAFRALHGDPRYLALLRKMNLPE